MYVCCTISKLNVHRLENWDGCCLAKKQAEGEALPITKASLNQMIRRANYQPFIWLNDIIADVLLPNVCDFGWSLADEGYTLNLQICTQLQMQWFSWSSIHANSWSSPYANKTVHVNQMDFQVQRCVNVEPMMTCVQNLWVFIL